MATAMSARTTKKCIKCGEVKPLDQFHRHPTCADGRIGKCKVCANLYISNWQRNNPEKVKAAKLRWEMRNPLLRVSSKQKYARNNSERIRGFRKAWSKRNPTKYLAHKVLTRYVHSGKIQKPNICSMCGKQCVTHGHHPDYSQQLLVVWACDACHKKIHSKSLDVTGLAIQYGRAK